MRALMRTSVLALLVLMAVVASVFAQDANPLFKDTKIKNYIPHMTWREVEQALTHTDMVVIPVGSNEQHGPHLPLGTDTFAALETCKLLAQRTDILVAPVVLAGVSEHHMGFPGTITLSPETFEAVVIDTARSLIRHGFKKLMIFNGHGGNTPALRAAVEKINQTTSATAVLLDDLKLPERGRDARHEWGTRCGREAGRAGPGLARRRRRDLVDALPHPIVRRHVARRAAHADAARHRAEGRGGAQDRPEPRAGRRRQPVPPARREQEGQFEGDVEQRRVHERRPAHRDCQARQETRSRRSCRRP